jgi:hypothetical protein
VSRLAGRHAARRRRNARLVGLGVGAAALVGVLVVASVSRGGASPAGTRAADAGLGRATVAQTETAATVAATAPRSGSVVPEAPRRVVLPSGRSVPVVAVGTTGAGVLDVPPDVEVAGWWRGGARLGDPFGSVLVSAHVDSSEQGLGPFVELLGVRPGETVVLTSERLSQEYAVSSLRLLDKGPLSDQAWIHSATGPHRLVLVTCAGPFDPRRGGYQRLAVVTATAVGDPTRRSS